MSGDGDDEIAAVEVPVGEVLERIASLAEELIGHPDVGPEVAELLDWVDAFHREGIGRLVEMIRAWRGEIFLEAVAADDVAGLLLSAYGLPGDDAGEVAAPATPSPVSIPLPARRQALAAPLQIRSDEHR